MNSMKNKVLLTLMILLMNQNVWSQTLDLYCQGRYQTGELLQLKLKMDIGRSILISDDKTTPLAIDDFNIVWMSQANGIQFESVLNRWTGELSATMINPNDIQPNFLTGICQTPDKIKF